jgi:hypothetical protein
VSSQYLDCIKVLRQMLLAEERMNHAMTALLQPYDGELLGVDFVAFHPPILMGVEVVSHHLAVEQATVEGASDRLHIGHIFSAPSRVWPRETLLWVEQRLDGQPFHAKQGLSRTLNRNELYCVACYCCGDVQRIHRGQACLLRLL